MISNLNLKFIEMAVTVSYLTMLPLIMTALRLDLTHLLRKVRLTVIRKLLRINLKIQCHVADCQHWQEPVTGTVSRTAQPQQ